MGGDRFPRTSTGGGGGRDKRCGLDDGCVGDVGLEGEEVTGSARVGVVCESEPVEACGAHGTSGRSLHRERMLPWQLNTVFVETGKTGRTGI